MQAIAQAERDYLVSCGHCDVEMMRSKFHGHTCLPESIVRANRARRNVQRDYKAWPGYRFVSEYLKWARKAFELTAQGRTVRTNWAGSDLDASAWAREFHSALHLRILLKGRVPVSRKWDSDARFRLPLTRNIG